MMSLILNSANSNKKSNKCVFNGCPTTDTQLYMYEAGKTKMKIRMCLKHLKIYEDKGHIMVNINSQADGHVD